MGLIEKASKVKDQVQRLNCRVVEAGLAGQPVLFNGGSHIAAADDRLVEIAALLSEMIIRLTAEGAQVHIALSPNRDLAQVVVSIPQALLGDSTLPPRVRKEHGFAIWDSGPVSNPTNQGVGF